jgi:predicted NodU family carbamoyl transferase
MSRDARLVQNFHVDNTARPQIVREADNPLFAGILRRFRDRTGIPVLINRVSTCMKSRSSIDRKNAAARWSTDASIPS